MALVKCPECGRQVSDKATACPNCGCPIESNIKKEQSVFHLGRKIKEDDPAWLLDFKKTGKGRKIAFLIIAGILAIVGAVCLPVGLSKNSTGVIVLGSMCLSFVFFFLLLALLFKAKSRFVVDEYGEFVIALHLYGHNELLVNGEEVLYEGHYHTEIDGDEDGTTSREVLDRATFILPDETRCQIIIAKRRCTFKYDPKGTYSNAVQNVVINNTIVNRKKGNPQRSDMEKILIKNAKIDALASIDPTNTKKAKEQIDIVNKLDNLD